MQVSVEICLVPIGVGVSVSPYVATCQRVLEQAGLTGQLHAYGTNVEGDWDVVMRAVKACHEAVHAQGAPRIFTTLKVGTRTDRKQALPANIRRVEARLASPPDP